MIAANSCLKKHAFRGSVCGKCSSVCIFLSAFLLNTSRNRIRRFYFSSQRRHWASLNVFCSLSPEIWEMRRHFLFSLCSPRGSAVGEQSCHFLEMPSENLPSDIQNTRSSGNITKPAFNKNLKMREIVVKLWNVLICRPVRNLLLWLLFV